MKLQWNFCNENNSNKILILYFFCFCNILWHRWDKEPRFLCYSPYIFHWWFRKNIRYERFYVLLLNLIYFSFIRCDMVKRKKDDWKLFFHVGKIEHRKPIILHKISIYVVKGDQEILSKCSLKSTFRLMMFLSNTKTIKHEIFFQVSSNISGRIANEKY